MRLEGWIARCQRPLSEDVTLASVQPDPLFQMLPFGAR